MAVKFAARLLLALMMLIRWTCRFRYFGLENLREAVESSAPRGYSFATWHENAMATIAGKVGVPCCFLVSPSKDGELVNYVSTRLGFYVARGSSSRGGRAARDELIDMLKKGIATSFTVDGPRGPRHQAKAGVLKVAMETNTAILPVAVVADRAWILSQSWDKMRIPKPFSRISFQFGSPIFADKGLDGSEFTSKLDELNATLMKTGTKAERNLNEWEKGAQRLPAFAFEHVL